MFTSKGIQRMATATKFIDLRLFATLAAHMPPEADHYPIECGITVGHLLERLRVPATDVKLVFINGTRGGLHSSLRGGERVGVFPPVGGG
jgi:molybdopterin converting factor small subunit